MEMIDLSLRFALFAVVHSVLATDTVKRKVISLWPWTGRAYRLVYNILAMATLCWVLAAIPGSPLLYRAPTPLDGGVRFAQLALLLTLCRCTARTGLGGFLGISQLRTGKDPSPTLVTDGWYRLVRHPQYVLAVIILLINPVMTVHGALFSLFTLIYCAVGASIEEVRLEQLFGEAYRTYRSTTPMFIPWLKRGRS